jgi:hypothetical protein
MLGMRTVAAHAVLHGALGVVTTAAECALRHVEVTTAHAVLPIVSTLRAWAEAALAEAGQTGPLPNMRQTCISVRQAPVVRSGTTRALRARTLWTRTAAAGASTPTRITRGRCGRAHACIVARATVAMSAARGSTIPTAWNGWRRIGQTCLELIATRRVACGGACFTRLESVKARLRCILSRLATRAERSDVVFGTQQLVAVARRAIIGTTVEHRHDGSSHQAHQGCMVFLHISAPA